MATKAVPKLSALRQALFKLFQQFDENDDKLIDFDEFTKAMAGFNVEDEKQLMTLFNKFDSDGQGIKYTEFLNQNESAKFVAFLNALNIAYENDENEQKNGKLHQHDQDKDNDSDLLASLLKIAQQKTQALSEEVEQLRNEKSMLQSKHDELQKEMSMLRNELVIMQNIKHEHESENERMQLSHKELIQSSQTELQSQRDRNQELEQELSALSNQLSLCNQLNTRLKAENNRLLQSTQNLGLCCHQLEEKCTHLEMQLQSVCDINDMHLYEEVSDADPLQSLRNRNRTRTIVQPAYFAGIHAEHAHDEPEQEYTPLNDSSDRQTPETATAAPTSTAAVTATVAAADEIKAMLIAIKNDTQNIEQSVSSIKCVLDTAQKHKQIHNNEHRHNNTTSWWDWW